MKQIIIACLLSLMICSARAQGIQFDKGNFQEILQKAKQENKMIFMDCYTVWCGPCKALVKNVFPQKKVGDLFNQNFINIKVDMEKGEGIALKKKYGVTTFPTLLFLDKKGKVVRRLAGAPGAEDLIELAGEVVYPEKGIAYFNEQYKNGKREPEFILSYMKKLFRAGKDLHAQKVGKDYLNSTPHEDLFTTAGASIICYTGFEYGSVMFDFVVKNRRRLAQLEGVDLNHFDSAIQLSLWNHLEKMVKTKEKWAEVKKVLIQLERVYPYIDFEEWNVNFKINFLYAHAQYDKYYKAYDTKLRKIEKTDLEKGFYQYHRLYRSILQDGNLLYHHSFNTRAHYKKFIKKMEGFRKQNVGGRDVHAMLAMLYYKINDADNAFDAANKYIEMSEKEERKVDPYILKIKKKMEQERHK